MLLFEKLKFFFQQFGYEICQVFYSFSPNSIPPTHTDYTADYTLTISVQAIIEWQWVETGIKKFFKKFREE